MSIYSYLRKIYYIFDTKKRQKYLDSLIKNGLKLGNNVDIVGDYFFDPSHCFLITIEDNCTICPNVRLIAHDASTKKILGYTKMGRIHIMENCFIGDSVIILPNVTIGRNAIIGSGSVVTRDIPPDTVATGSPAKVIMTLGEYIEKIKHTRKDKKIFGEEYFIQNLNDEKRNEIVEALEGTIGFIK